MVKKLMYQKIQKLKKQGLSKYAITHKLGLDVATVRKYFVMEPDAYQAYQAEAQQRIKQFTDYEQEIILIYSSNGNQRLNMNAVYDYLEEQYGILPGGEKSLRNYIHYLEKEQKLMYHSGCRIYRKVPELPFGKQAQMDFGIKKQINGFVLYIFAMLLSTSRYRYVCFQDHPFTTMDVILHMLNAFDFFGGLPIEIVIDQDKLLVASENMGDIIYTKQFQSFIDEMGLSLYVCRKSDPASKGKIENLIKYIKYNFLQVRSFTTIAEANNSALKWLSRRANGKICSATKQIPNLMIEEERKHLRPIKNSIFRKDSYLGRELRSVSEKSYVLVDTNEYSVPTQYRGKDVDIYKTDTRLFFFDRKNGKEIAHHRLSKLTGQRICDKQHFRLKESSIPALRTEIRELFPQRSWQKFLAANKEAFSRYERDQLIYAKHNFQGISSPVIMEQAISYCLDHETYSMKNLLDTYEYLGNKQAATFSGENAPAAVLQPSHHQDITVAQRNLDSYEEHVSQAQGGVR